MDSIRPLQILNNERIPAKTSHTIDWNTDRVERETRLIAKKANELYREKAEWDEKRDRPILVNGDEVKWKDESGKAEFEELMADEKEVEFRPIRVDDLGPHCAPPPMVFRFLRWMFVEAEEPKEA